MTRTGLGTAAGADGLVSAQARHARTRLRDFLDELLDLARVAPLAAAAHRAALQLDDDLLVDALWARPARAGMTGFAPRRLRRLRALLPFGPELMAEGLRHTKRRRLAQRRFLRLQELRFEFGDARLFLFELGARFLELRRPLLQLRDVHERHIGQQQRLLAGHLRDVRRSEKAPALAHRLLAAAASLFPVEIGAQSRWRQSLQSGKK